MVLNYIAIHLGHPATTPLMIGFCAPAAIQLARKLGVFKVEMIGDCYVAIAGLPEPSNNHAIVLARFAWKWVLTTISVCKRLEATLGPGTADLALRLGLHSGPVTAGVLRGEKSRFQLFGDTMNTASRVESNGMKNMVQVSINC